MCKEMCEGAAEQEMELAAACAQDGTAAAKKGARRGLQQRWQWWFGAGSELA